MEVGGEMRAGGRGSEVWTGVRGERNGGKRRKGREARTVGNLGGGEKE